MGPFLNLNKLHIGAPDFTKDEEVNWANWGPQRTTGFAGAYNPTISILTHMAVEVSLGEWTHIN